MSDVALLNLVNAALGLVTVACVALVVAVIVPESVQRRREVREARRLAAPAGHSARVKAAWRDILPRSQWLW